MKTTISIQIICILFALISVPIQGNAAALSETKIIDMIPSTSDLGDGWAMDIDMLDDPLDTETKASKGFGMGYGVSRYGNFQYFGAITDKSSAFEVKLYVFESAQKADSYFKRKLNGLTESDYEQVDIGEQAYVITKYTDTVIFSVQNVVVSLFALSDNKDASLKFAEVFAQYIEDAAKEETPQI